LTVSSRTGLPPSVRRARHERKGEQMATNRPDPGEFLELAQRMLRELFGDSRSDDDPWAEATRRPHGRSETPPGNREPSTARQRENLTFALATRAVEALEDLALNVAAMRQRLERMDVPPRESGPKAKSEAHPKPTPSADPDADPT
jgi:hypothetical protein